MSSHANNTKENKSQAVANSLAKQQGNDLSAFQFEDNREEAAVRREQQETIKNSPQTKQLRDYQAIADNFASIPQKKFQKKAKNLSTNSKPLQKVAQLVKAHLGGDVDEDFDSTNDKSASEYLDWLVTYSDSGLTSEDVNHEFIKDVATRSAEGKYGEYALIIKQRLEKLKAHQLVLKLGDSLTPKPSENETGEERLKREEREAGQAKERAIEEQKEKERMEWITKVHAALKTRYESSKNQAALQLIMSNKSDYLIYRGEWYERSLKILDMGTFGGAPPVGEGQQLLKTSDQTFKTAKDKQKERGGDDVKEILNEWTTDISLAKTYGERFVMLIGLIDKPKEGQEHVVYPNEKAEGEKGVLADSRFPLKAVAIMSITDKPNFEKKAKGGS